MAFGEIHAAGDTISTAILYVKARIEGVLEGVLIATVHNISRGRPLFGPENRADCL